MAGDIIRYLDEEEDGIYTRTILGLNLYRSNQSFRGIEDPIKTFLRRAIDENNCSLHVDLSIWMKTPEEFFPTVNTRDCCWITHVGLYQRFHYSDENDCCFFPSDTLQIFNDYYDELFDYESTALYVRATDLAIQKIRLHLEQPPVDDVQLALKPYGWRDHRFHMTWLKIATSLYPLIIVNGHDGDFFEVHTKSPRHYNLLSGAIDSAIALIEKSTWYKQHCNELVWDDDERCLRK